MTTRFPLLLPFLCLFSAGVTYAQTRLVEKVTRQGNELVIPYEKYVLPNSLTLIVHEDHSDPIVHVDVTYHVGSAREEIGKSGFAHFFEHMMFQGSDHVADDEHFKIVTESGGTLNGSTNRDRTNYYETLPSNQLERALWLEADRMGFLLDAVTQKKFEIQRATVKNERGQNYDNRPYGLAGEYVAKNLYAYGHPYSWLTIGYIEDLNRVNVNDLKNFFLRWYGPNNAVLTIGGDVTAKQVVALTEKYFGSIPRGPEVTKTQVPTPVVDKDRYVSYEDNVRFPMLQLVFPTVPNYHPDEAPLDALAEILGGGKNSLFYKNLVKTQLAVQANASHPATELAGQLAMVVLPFPGKSLDSTEAVVRRTLAEFERRGATDDDIAQFRATREADLINGLSSVSGKVSQLAAFQTYLGNPNYLPQELKRYKSVTKADVMRVYNQYIKGKNAVILTVYPKGKPEIVAKPDNYTVSTANYKAPDYGYNGLAYTKPKDSFDRAVKPGPGPNPALKVPPFWNDKLPNGIKVIGARNDEIPAITMLFTIKGGHLLEANDPSKAGVAQLTASLMNEATQNYTNEQLNTKLEKLGSSIDIRANTEEITISVEALIKNLDSTLALVEEKLLRPKFAQDDFDRLKKQQLELISNQSTQPVVIANKAYSKLLYGSANIRSVPLSGTTKTVETITLDDVKAFYKNYLSPSVTNMVVVGDIEQAAIMPKLAFLSKWAAKPVKIPTTPAPKKIDKTRLYLIDKEQAAQSEIRIGYLTNMPYDATGDYYKAALANYMLGGAFSSRINMNLREDKGYTYGARSGFSSTNTPGPFTAQAGVKAAATDSSVIEFVKEITNYAKSGITEQELAFVKSSLGQSDALRYETSLQKAFFLSRIIEYNLPRNYVEQQSEILRKITKAEIDAVAKKQLPINNMIITVVGNKQLIKPGLEKLGYELVELDKEGNVLGSSTTPADVPAGGAPAKMSSGKKN
ncbi:M16 family metallopeptidase [Spirosoma linguale]|uniref:Peptidase M16 domain protein n=1 Tax=Spirosoma linguale (strain ATCC 33905 / DSM 74 / LMG 10896 / Claus 1) TaxID=504472 RepID=D2QJW1_SPILD|nr:peptidase M16 domain protein [Spirosoma linguale DSM 74]